MIRPCVRARARHGPRGRYMRWRRPQATAARAAVVGGLMINKLRGSPRRYRLRSARAMVLPMARPSGIGTALPICLAIAVLDPTHWWSSGNP